MALTPFNIGLPINNNTPLTAGYFANLAANITSWGSQFMPLSGGTFVGPVLWTIAQRFPANQTVLPSNPTYPHQNTWRTVWDHINDPSVHQQPGPPQAHAATHAIGGSDLLYGSTLGISPTAPSTSIKTYVDTSVATALATAPLSYAPSAYYEIGGSDLLYGNLIAISSGSASTSIKSYVDAAISALSGSIPANPSFTSVTSGSVLFSSGASLTAYSVGVLTSNTSNLYLRATSNTGLISFSGPSSTFATLSSAGLAIGSTTLSGTSGNINGALTIGGDVSVSRAQLGKPNVGQLGFGATNSGAYLSWGLDTASFYLSKPLTVFGNVTIGGGGTVQVGTILNVSTTGIALSGVPVTVVTADKSGTVITGADSNGSLSLRTSLASGRPFIDFTQDASSTTSPTYTQRFQLSSDGTSLGTTGGLTGLSFSANGGFIGASGDLGTARASGSGQINFGTSTGNSLDFGVAANGVFTFTVGATAVASVSGSGAFTVGSSSYGATATSVAGTITATKAVVASTGLTTAGFVFGSATDTGMLSNGSGDLRLYSGGSAALAFSGSAAVFAGNVSIANALVATSLASSGAILAGGDLTLAGTLYAGNGAISKFRSRNSLYMGYNSSTSSTSFVYPNITSPNYASGTIDVIRLSAITADTTGTQTTVQITKNGTVIGTVALPNGQKTAKNYPIVGNTPISEGDVLQAVCTVAGTSTGVAVTLEISSYLY